MKRGDRVWGIDSWRNRIHGEPALDALMSDPLTHLLMRRDGVSPQNLSDVVERARHGLWHRQEPDCRNAA